MAKAKYEFRNVILCDDIRSEMGNKKSLMGVLAGDIIVAEMPATIYLAIYAEFLTADLTKETAIKLRLLQDSEEIAKANIAARTAKQSHSIVLPRALITFEKDCMFKIVASVNDEKEVEILSKTVSKGPVT